jgi:endonuclease YncB( thermonuclease family)
MTGNIWTVPATVVRVVDGDTVVLDLDLGWHITYRSRCRVIGVNAPELSTEEGQSAKTYVAELFAGLVPVPVPEMGAGAQVVFMSHALDKYGRPLGQIGWTDAQGGRFDLGSMLLESGNAVPMR